MTLRYVAENFRGLLARRELVFVLVKKALREKHIGSVLGFFWTFYTALFPLLSYTFVFFFIAGVRVPGAESPGGYLVFVFSGLLPWLFFSRVTTESVDALNSNLDLLKQAIFPVEMITLVSSTENLVVFSVQCVALVLLMVFVSPASLLKLVMLPLFVAALFFFCLGLGWILSIVGMFLRDMKDVVTSLLHFLLYVTPTLYAKENVPDALWPLFQLNPMTHAINFFRDIVYYSDFRSLDSIGIFLGLTAVAFIGGYAAILTAKKTIGDMV